MLIVLSGTGRVGKDTAAGIIKNIFISNSETCVTIAYADFLKEILSKCFNLTAEHLYGDLKEVPVDFLPIRTRSGKITNHLWTPRKLLQFLGTDVLRTIDPECWINVVKNFIDNTSYDNYVITDARFDNEVEWVLVRGGIQLHITREDKDFVGGSEHASENSLSNTAVSDAYYHIENDKDLVHLESTLLTIIDKEKDNGR
ncbi:hypothetical protein JZU46_00220 [bacterium]|nr:hypothetical protein [bacterium]